MIHTRNGSEVLDALRPVASSRGSTRRRAMAATCSLPTAVCSSAGSRCRSGRWCSSTPARRGTRSPPGHSEPRCWWCSSRGQRW